MSLPSRGEEFARLIEYLRLAQESASRLAHLHGDTSPKDRLIAKGWLVISEGLKLMQSKVTDLATGKLS